MRNEEWGIRNQEPGTRNQEPRNTSWFRSQTKIDTRTMLCFTRMSGQDRQPIKKAPKDKIQITNKHEIPKNECPKQLTRQLSILLVSSIYSTPESGWSYITLNLEWHARQSTDWTDNKNEEWGMRNQEWGIRNQEPGTKEPGTRNTSRFRSQTKLTPGRCFASLACPDKTDNW